jgi:glucose dehydrogenase
LLNRVTGKSILGVAEKKVPQLKGAAAKYANLSKTQPYPVGDAFTSQCSTRKQWPGKAPDGKPYIVGCIFTPYAYVKGQASFLASTPAAEGGVDWQPSAYDPATHYQYLSTPGLVFAGQENTKQLGAYDPATGKNLWLSSALQTAPGGPPVTYTAGGKQYIVVLGNAGLIYGFTL